MTEKKNSGCLVCGAELVYAGRAEAGRCYYCGQAMESYIRCPEGHLVCDDCHRQDALAVLSRICQEEAVADPVQMANKIMRLPYFSMHGPEHHALVPAVLVASFGKATGQDVTEQLEEAVRRGGRIPGGICGSYGSCGAGVGVGAAVSILAGATPLTRKPWRMANQATARALWAIGERGGPRCCKRCTWTALEVGMQVLAEGWGVQWENKTAMEKACAFSGRNRQCLRRNCIYYPSQSS